MMTSPVCYKIRPADNRDVTKSGFVEIKQEEAIEQGYKKFTMHADSREHQHYVDPSQLTSFTCEELGIPQDDVTLYNRHPIKNTSLHVDGLRYETMTKRPKDPFSPHCLIPLPAPFGLDAFDSSCVRRRNERERDRVRCVNEGYIKLKHHLPIDNKNKRLSKVETLRCAIKYIRHLESLLNASGGISDVTYEQFSGCETSNSDRSFTTSEDESSSDNDSRTGIVQTSMFLYDQ